MGTVPGSRWLLVSHTHLQSSKKPNNFLSLAARWGWGRAATPTLSSWSLESSRLVPRLGAAAAGPVTSVAQLTFLPACRSWQWERTVGAVQGCRAVTVTPVSQGSHRKQARPPGGGAPGGGPEPAPPPRRAPLGALRTLCSPLEVGGVASWAQSCPEGSV